MNNSCSSSLKLPYLNPRQRWALRATTLPAARALPLLPCRSRYCLPAYTEPTQNHEVKDVVHQGYEWAGQVWLNLRWSKAGERRCRSSLHRIAYYIGDAALASAKILPVLLLPLVPIAYGLEGHYLDSLLVGKTSFAQRLDGVASLSAATISNGAPKSFSPSPFRRSSVPVRR